MQLKRSEKESQLKVNDDEDEEKRGWLRWIGLGKSQIKE
jgi:hypothetical protein